MFEDVTTIADQLKFGRISSLELCREVLANVERCNGLIGAYSCVLSESAENEAKASDRRRRRSETLGPLDGIPIAVKDIIDTTPAVCKAGLEGLSRYRPQRDADVVASLRRAGAVIIGVAETDSGAFGTRTLQTINPVAPEHIAGGSSGGSAAAVCGGLAFAALGTDTGGSIRIPAACCSISGFKPTWGRTSTRGVRPLAASYDHVGLLGRRVADLKVMQSVLELEANLSEIVGLPPSIRIGISKSYFSDADAAIAEAINGVVDKLTRAGNIVRRVEMPDPHEVVPFHMINVAREAANYHLEVSEIELNSYPSVAREGIEFGLRLSAEAVELAQAARARARAKVDQAFNSIDVILLPTLAVDVPRRELEVVNVGGRLLAILESTVWYTSLFNQTGHPVLSIPGVAQESGRAISLQLVGPRNHDARLLDIGTRIEEILAIRVDYARLLRRNGDLIRSVREGVCF